MDPELPELRVKTLMSVGVLANLALGWLVAGLFPTGGPTAIILAMAASGAGLAAITSRGSRGIASLVVPLLPLGLLWLSVSTQHSAGRLLGSLARTLTSGQLGDPPVPFTPAWQLLVSALLLLIGVGSIMLALIRQSYRAVLIVPVLVSAVVTFVQPTGRELIGVGGALVLLLIALMVASGAQTALETGQSAGVDLARFIRAAILIGAVVLVLAGLSFSGVGLTRNTAEAPRPAAAPIAAHDLASTPLFELRAPRPVALRTGVLASYDGTQWLTPAFKPDDLVTVDNGQITRTPAGSRGVATVAVRVLSPQVGRFVPLPAGTFEVDGIADQATWDPAANSLRLPVAADVSLAYRARFAVRDQADLNQIELSTFDPGDTVPPEISAVLNESTATSAYARLTELRRALFDRAQVSSGGSPTPVSPERALQIFQGAPATGYELAATEGLLARWAGLDARLGYGYVRLAPEADGSYLVRGSDAATWVELQTADGSWVPLLDRPRSGAPQQPPAVQIVPNGAKTAQLEIPLHTPDPSIMAKVVKYWLTAYAAVGLGLLVLWVLVPSVLRLRRTLQRQRWAADQGPAARVLVAYAALRDKAIDLEVGTPTASVLEFLDQLTPDEDHVEFAWLVNRVLYGDLRRDTTDADADLAEAFSASLVRRLAQGQSYLHRLACLGTHRSLRTPWTTDGGLPTGYPAWLHSLTARRWTRRRTLAVVATTALVLLAIPAIVGVQRIPVRDLASPPLPAVPTSVLDLGFEPIPDGAAALETKREQALIGAARLYLVTQAGQPVGTLQTSTFKASLDPINLDVRRGLLDSLGMTEVRRVGNQVFFARSLGQVNQTVWFSPDGQTYQLLTTEKSVAEPMEMLARLVAAQAGENPREIAKIKAVTPSDIRQGSLQSETKRGKIAELTKLPPREAATP